MDWRIARGGVTADEVRRVAVLGGQESPSDDDVETVCLMWRQAIDDFVTEQAQKSFLATGALSAADWESLRERVLVVHEHSVVDELVEDVSDELLGEAADEEDDDYDASVEKLSKEIGAHLTGGDPVSGFRNARAAVPALARFEHLGDVTRPWRAALYIRPDSAAAI